MSLNDLVSLQIAAGPAADKVTTGLFHLEAQLGEAAGGSVEARAKFAQLGLDWKELAGLSPEQVFRKTADAIAAMPDPVQRTSAAMAVFSRRGARELLPMLTQGSAGLDKAREKAERFHLTMTAGQAAGVGRAGEAMKDAGRGAEGLWNTLAIKLAPAIEQIGNRLADWAVALQPGAEAWGEMLLGVTDVLQTGMGLVEEWAADFRDLGLGMDKSGEKLTTFRDIAIDNLENLAKAFAVTKAIWDSDLIHLPKTLWKISQFFDKARNRDRSPGPETAEILSDGGAGYMAKLQNRVTMLNAELKKQADTFGLAANEAKVWQLAQDGASEAMLEETRFLVKYNQGLDLAFKVRPGMEKLAEGFGKINDIANAVGMTDQQRGLAMLDMLGPGGAGSTRLAGAADAGSQQAQSIISQAMAGSQQDPVARINEMIRVMQVQDANRAHEAKALLDAYRAGKIDFRPAGV